MSIVKESAWPLAFLLPILLCTAGAPKPLKADDDDDGSAVVQERLRSARFEEANRLRSEADKLYQQGNYQKVIETTNLLLNQYGDDNVHVAYHMRASAKIELGRRQRSAALVRDGINDARSALGAANGKHPWTNIPYLYGLTSLAELERRPEHAEAAIKWVSPLLARPTDAGYTPEDKANLFYQRGLAQRVKNDHKASVADFEEAIKLAAVHLAAHLKRAEGLELLSRLEEARKAYDLAIERFPRMIVVHNDRGGFRRRRGDLDGAIDDFSRALQIDPKFALGYVNRALCLLDQANPEAAEQDLEQALKLRPELPLQGLAYRLRGAARLGRGASTLAIADYDQAARLLPKDPQIPEERAVAWFCRQKFDAAAADFEAAMKLDPALKRLLPWRVAALLRSGNRAAAQRLADATRPAEAGESDWPGRLCRLLLGAEDPAALREAASAADPAIREFRLLEALFFEAQSLTIAGNADEAAARFKLLIEAASKAPWLARVSRYETGAFP
jgi:tetratricopeptide (TPR) repeat protein